MTVQVYRGTSPIAVNATASDPRAVHALQEISHPPAELNGPTRIEVVPAREVSPEICADWDDLAEHASTPNVFYERWNMEPAIRHLSPVEDLQLVLVYRRGTKPDSVQRLCGLIPLIQQRSGRLSPSAWRLWGHPYAYLRTPLLRAGHERAVLDAAFDWLEQLPRGPRLLDWPLVDGEGPFARTMTDLLLERGLVWTHVERHTRAMLQRETDWESAAATQLSSHHRRELRRLHRRLSEQGQLTLRTISRPQDCGYWTHIFLELERSGWKGTHETAIASQPASKAYFEELISNASAAGKLQMLGLFLNGEPIALKLNLLTQSGGFACKIAYDEQFSRFSPGIQLEIENIRMLHNETALDWMDSCAVANHSMINRLWSGRRAIDRLQISLGGLRTNLRVGGRSLGKAVKRSLTRQTPHPIARD
ncbi:MAG: GNAT family N-acetyltransferase [Planctomycetaceae bacterium]|nr:GNAT family N-acetyltransferase [Planctomycetaceae bacterium]